MLKKSENKLTVADDSSTVDRFVENHLIISAVYIYKMKEGEGNQQFCKGVI